MGGVVETTTYKVELLYDIKGEPEKKLDSIAKHAERASHGMNLLERGMAALGIGLGIESAKKHLIDFNSEVQNAKIGLSAMLQGNYGVKWDTAVKGADALYAEFQRFSQLTPVTTQEMLQFGRGVAVATAQAGGSIKDITTITEQGVVAAKALGAESGYASLELTEMLQGNVSRRMRFAQQLLGMAHMDEKHFKELSAGQRLGVVEKVLNSDAMKNATTAFSTSFTGVLSTLEDKLQILIGRIGLPLFQKITAEIAEWNKWIDANQEKVERFISSVGNGLVTAFDAVKTAFQFIYDHADILLTIGKVWAAVKVGNMASGMLGGISGMGGLGATVSGFSGLAAALGPAIGAGIASYMAANALGAGKLGSDIGSHLYDMVHGSDNVANKFAGLATASQAVSDAFRVVAVGSGKRETQMQDMRTQRESQLAMLRGIYSEYATAGNIDAVSRLGTKADATGRLQMDYGDQLNAVGLTSGEVQSAGGIAGMINQIVAANQKYGDAQDAAAYGLKSAPMLGISREQLAETRVSNALFSKLVDFFLHGGQRVKSHWWQEDSYDVIRNFGKDLANEKDPFKGQANLQQNNTYNMTIEVAAKDPDRWIAEVDAKMRRKVNAPTQPRAAMTFKGGSM